MEKEKVIRKLEKLTFEPGFIFSLAAMLLGLFYNPEEATDINWRERLSFQEISFLVGLMAKQEIDQRLPTEEVLKVQIQKTHEFFSNLHKAHRAPVLERIIRSLKENESSGDVDGRRTSIFGSGEVMAEPLFYSGSGAYDFQYLEFAKRRYRNDEGWIRATKGLDMETMTEIAARLRKLGEEKVNNFPLVKNFNEFCKETLSIFCFSPKELTNFGHDVIECFLNIFSLIPGSANKSFSSPGAYNVFDSHPIIRLKDDLYFLPVFFNLARSIYESPFYWMLEDEKYRDISLVHRGDVTEYLSLEMLRGVFGRENVYRGVRVYKNKKEVVDIDVLAIAGNKAVILQAKSKKLTELSRIGDDESLKNDFKKAIQEAYEQGLTCRTALLDEQSKLVSRTGEPIHSRELIDDAYIICLTSDNYPAVTHQVGVYLTKKPSDPYPIALSIFDLDILVFYLRDPFEFLYYLQQRVNLANYFKANSEVSLLAYHLKQKLFPRQEADQVIVDESMAQLIDANFPAMRGIHPITKAAEKLHNKWPNKKFEQLIAQIKQTKDPGFTDALFFLYDLAGAGADDLIKLMEQTKQKSLQDRKSHNFSMIFEKGKSGITFICESGKSELLGKKLLALSMARKYKTKADVWLGLGNIATSQNIIDTVVFNKHPWKPDKDIEELTRLLLTKPGKVMNSKEQK